MLVILIQYSQRHSMIIHCDRCITFLSDTEIPFGVFNLLLHLICLLGDSNQHSKCKSNFEDISNLQKIDSSHQDE